MATVYRIRTHRTRVTIHELGDDRRSTGGNNRSSVWQETTVIVTGASQGIGAAVVQAFLDRTWRFENASDESRCHGFPGKTIR
jgi:hypothetical protein